MGGGAAVISYKGKDISGCFCSSLITIIKKRHKTAYFVESMTNVSFSLFPGNQNSFFIVFRYNTYVLCICTDMIFKIKNISYKL